ncbi:MAG: DUF1016 domain-containing protein [Legionellales bacterium]|nr:DUF1016 domain-containing protein [Legionellales bacterium]
MLPIDIDDDVQALFKEISQLIENARQQVVSVANSTLTMTYWYTGKAIHTRILHKQEGLQSSYGEKIVYALGRQLQAHHGKSFSRANIYHCIRFYQAYPNEEIVYPLGRQLFWTHFRHLIYIENETERAFYTQLCIHENWATRVLKQKMDGMLFQRTALAKKPDELIYRELKQLGDTGKMSTELAFRDPYLLNFLELPDPYSESDFENSILTELSQFLQEFGSDFCFVARQKRMSIGRKDYVLDLLFFHRGLRRLIALELKLNSFKPEHKGQMELYLKWLAKYEQRPGEEPPLGIILCSHKEQEEIELLELDKSDIHVAEYLVQLPPKDLLENKLHQAIERAKARLALNQLNAEEENHG